ncbi:SRPBCC family protein [Kineosporiaceae bacterium SCSIO 59966]|nr:SRPBCC family protein [Kineosporiaceae bacterium SCSIO 59966]
MATVVLRRDVPAPAGRVWQVATDWPRHGASVPFTDVVVTHDAGGTGTRFTGRTRLGPWTVDDPMEVVLWRPPTDADAVQPGRPGRCVVEKRGRVVLGWAALDVLPLGPRRCRMVWTEDVEIAPTAWTGWAAPAVRLASRAVFGALLRRLAQDAVQEDVRSRGDGS